MILAVVMAVAATLCAVFAVAIGFRTARKPALGQAGDMDLGELAQAGVVRGSQVDVARTREHSRRRRLWKLCFWLAPVSAFFYYRIATRNPIRIGLPSFSPTQMEIVLPIALIVLLGAVMIVPMMSAGKSPHIRYDPSEIDVTMNDVVGLGPVRQEVVNTLNLFLGYKTFREHMGGNPRKAILFEGPPGTGKTYMAKAMAREAGVPYLFVSSTAFQSMYYGQTGRKIRNYFKELRKAAREEGGAIGFIEEIDAIAGARSGMRSTPLPSGLNLSGEVNRSNSSEGISGVVNELLIQLQSFDSDTRQVRRLREPLAPGAPASAEEAPAGIQHPRDRRHQPGRRPRPGAVASGPLRPFDPLRRAHPVGTARDHRLLPRQESARARARQGRAP